MTISSVRVLFVCLGNICRSPTAQGVFQHMLARHPLHVQIEVDSAGTGGWHVGSPPDSRAIVAASQRGCDISHLRARQVSPSDFEHFDYILAMDAQNLRDLNALRPSHYQGTLCRFLDFAHQQGDVPDPYYGGEQGFADVYSLCEEASRGLLKHISRHHD